MITRCACGEPLPLNQGAACDLGRWASRADFAGVYCCADRRTAPLRPLARCLRELAKKRADAQCLVDQLAKEAEATRSFWAGRRRKAAAAAAALLCLSIAEPVQAVRKEPRKERKVKRVAAPVACSPRDPAACEGSPSRCYCPSGGVCSCVVRLAARCSACSPRGADCPRGMRCECSQWGCCCG